MTRLPLPLFEQIFREQILWKCNQQLVLRADNIVRDAETIRNILTGSDGRWSVLGQSFGGFCAVHYLSNYPEGDTLQFL